MQFGFLLFEENYQLNRFYMLNESFMSSAGKRVASYMLKDPENFDDNQRNKISIRNIKLSERTSRNHCIHSRTDVTAKPVKGKLVSLKMSHTNLKKESIVIKSVVVKQLMAVH